MDEIWGFMMPVQLVVVLKAGSAGTGEEKLVFDFPKARSVSDVQIVNGFALATGIRIEIPKDRLYLKLVDGTVAQSAQQEELGPIDKKRHALVKLDKNELAVIIEGLDVIAAREGLAHLDYRDTARKLSTQFKDKALRLKDPRPEEVEENE